MKIKMLSDHNLTCAQFVMAAWTREETFILINLWSENVMQDKLEGFHRNSLVFCKIADGLRLDGLRLDGFTCSMEQCRDKIKNLKAEYKKIHDMRGTTGQGRYQEWEYYDAIHQVMGRKHSTEPTVVLESFTVSQVVENSELDETQDMSGEVVGEQSGSPHPSGGQSSSNHSSSSGTDHASVDPGDTQASGSKGKFRKRKLGKRKATNELLEKMTEMQTKSDQLMIDLEEKRMRMEERQMEREAQMYHEERDHYFLILQMYSRYLPNPGPPAPLIMF